MVSSELETWCPLGLPTSHICDAEHPSAALLYHAALVGEQRDSSGRGA